MSHLHILALLSARGDDLDDAEFTSLLFLCSRTIQDYSRYEFIPTGRGIQSFTLRQEGRQLVKLGLIEKDEEVWRMTDAGRKVAADNRLLADELRQFVWKYRDAHGDELLAEIIREFPYYGTRIENPKLPPGVDADAIQRIRKARPRKSKPGLATIGYEGLSVEAYLNTLIRSGVTLLCDVRGNPMSRKFGFSKNTLAGACLAAGIRYEHLPQLGIASEDRRNIKTRADYDRLFAEYKRTSLPAQTASLQRIADWIEEGQRVALTCFEHDPAQCHRLHVALELERLFGPLYRAKHL